MAYGYALQINPDGSTQWLDDRRQPMNHARELFGGSVDVVSLIKAPTPECDAFNFEVGYVDDTLRLRERQPAVNVKAWLLYGRSPIVGSMIVATDSPHHLLTGDLDEFLVGTPAEILLRMGLAPAAARDVLGRMGRMAAAEGLALPEGWQG